MERDDPKPEAKPAGSGRPPRPPHRTAVGLCPDDDDSGRKRRATISKAADGEGMFIRHSGGRGNYGHVIVRIEPNGRGKGIVITSNVPASTVPVEYIKPVSDAVLDTLDYGVGDDGPIVDIVVHIVGGSWHENDSNELAFKMAGIFAIKDALKKADPIPIE